MTVGTGGYLFFKPIFKKEITIYLFSNQNNYK